MIVLDTNVLSEALRPVPSDVVLRWLTDQDRSTVFTTTVTQAELFYGAELLPLGKRRARLVEALEKILAEELQGRILPFDEGSARQFAKIVASRDASGRAISQFDAMIAAIARSNQAAVATRDVSDFEHCGIRVIDPWKE
jgi:predicted nucleic acid-binding protein